MAELSWQSAFWALVPLCMSAMLQSPLRIRGIDPRIGVFLRCSSIVTGIHSLAVIFEFVMRAVQILRRKQRGSLAAVALAARNTLSAHRQPHESVSSNVEASGNDDTWTKLFLACGLAVGCLTQWIKLLGCRGIPSVQTWACCYASPFVVTTMLQTLAFFASDEQARGTEIVQGHQKWFWIDVIFLLPGVLLQLTMLAVVDLDIIPPDPNFMRRWLYRGLRLCGHFAIVHIHVPFMILEYQGQRKALLWLHQHSKAVVAVSFLLLNVLQATLHGLNMRYTHMYYMWSVIASSTAWVLYHVPVLRTSVLGCRNRIASAPNSVAGGVVQGRSADLQHVLAFDFALRTVVLTVYWFMHHYDPTSTFKPGWVENLG